MICIFSCTKPDLTNTQGLKNRVPQRRIFKREVYHVFLLHQKGVIKYGIDEEYTASCYSETMISMIISMVGNKFESRPALNLILSDVGTFLSIKSFMHYCDPDHTKFVICLLLIVCVLLEICIVIQFLF